MSIKDSISIFQDKAICYETKTIKIFGEIDSDMKDIVISNLHILDQKTGEVTILLSSEGGCVTSGLDIVDAIRAMKNHVRIITYGEVSSMASVIFQAADQGKRYMMPNSYLMLHEGSASLSGKKKDRKEWERLQEWQEKICVDLYLKKIKEQKKRFTRSQLLAKLDKDWVLLPKEAIEYGLADEILETY